MRTRQEVHRALVLLSEGQTPSEVARLLGVPRSTVRDWGSGRVPTFDRGSGECTLCGRDRDLSRLEPEAYGYLLGMYLGDGCLSLGHRGVRRLRISLDAAYQGIISECTAAVTKVASGRVVNAYRIPGSRCVVVYAYWKHWPCLLPQHGAGPKHTRRIALEEWQRRIVEADPKPFLRGLIHSDGTRIVAVERKGRYVRRAPRYAFRNRSEDILHLFCLACGLAGIRYTRPSRTQIAVYRKQSVARLDEFIGPKNAAGGTV